MDKVRPSTRNSETVGAVGSAFGEPASESECRVGRSGLADLDRGSLRRFSAITTAERAAAGSNTAWGELTKR